MNKDDYYHNPAARESREIRIVDCHAADCPHMPIGKVRIIVTVCVCVCLFVCTVTDFSAEDKVSGVKFLSAFHRQGITHFCELCSPRSSKSDESAVEMRRRKRHTRDE